MFGAGAVHWAPLMVAAGRAAPRGPGQFHPIMWVDIAIFLLTYAGLAFGHLPGLKTDRTGIAMLGAIAILLLGRMTFPQAMHSISFSTLALLFGLMMISSQLHLAGFYRGVIDHILRLDGRPWTTLITIVVVGAALSALFANDIVCLVFTPVLCIAMKRCGRDPIPYLIAMVTGSNIGSAATLIGNPQNMLIGQTAHIAFGRYTLIAAPLVIICLAIDVLAVALVYRKRIFAGNGNGANAPEQAAGRQGGKGRESTDSGGGGGDDSGQRVDRQSIFKTLVIMLALLVLFVIGRNFGLHRDVAALGAAGLLLLTRKHETQELIAHVNWKLALLLIGLFIVIGDLELHGLLQMGLAALKHMGIHISHPWPLTAVTVALSNVASNVPAVLLLIPGIQAHGGRAENSWMILAVVSTFAGNFCLLGSIANIIVAEQARAQKVKISFWEFSKVGIPVTIISAGLAGLYLSFVR